MWERFFDRHPLVPLPTINCKHARVENDLVRIFKNLLGGVGRGAGVSVHNCVIDLMPDNLDGVDGGV